MTDYQKEKKENPERLRGLAKAVAKELDCNKWDIESDAVRSEVKTSNGETFEISVSYVDFKTAQ